MWQVASLGVTWTGETNSYIILVGRIFGKWQLGRLEKTWVDRRDIGL
jgi:hypothetical protein